MTQDNIFYFKDLYPYFLNVVGSDKWDNKNLKQYANKGVVRDHLVKYGFKKPKSNPIFNSHNNINNMSLTECVVKNCENKCIISCSGKLVGGHVWMKNWRSKKWDVYIIPICGSHNVGNNALKLNCSYNGIEGCDDRCYLECMNRYIEKIDDFHHISSICDENNIKVLCVGLYNEYVNNKCNVEDIIESFNKLEISFNY